MKAPMTSDRVNRTVEGLLLDLLQEADAAAAGVDDRLAAYVDGQLEPAEREILEAELSERPDLEIAVAELLELRQELAQPGGTHSNVLRWPRARVAARTAGAALAAGLAGIALLSGVHLSMKADAPSISPEEVRALERELEPIFVAGFEDPSLTEWEATR